MIWIIFFLVVLGAFYLGRHIEAYWAMKKEQQVSFEDELEGK